MRKNIIIALSLIIISSCQHNNYSNKKTIQVEQYQPVNSQRQAEKINDQVQARIDEQIEEIEVKDRVFFSYDSAELSPQAKEILDVQSQWLSNDETINIIIEGHCDERGTREYNIALGEKRAYVVKDFLIKKGIRSSRIKTVSFGKEKPAFFGTTPEIMAKNRRSVTVIQ